MSDSKSIVRDELFDSMLGDFLDESGQLLDRLNENLLQLDEWVRALDDDHDQSCDGELLNEMFRSAHSLKGLSAMLGLNDINNLTHKIENVFDAARRGDLVVGGDVVEMMFQGVDQLVSLVDLLKEPDAEPVECDSVIEGIRELLQAAGVERGQSSQADAERALSSIREEVGGESPAAVSADTSDHNAPSFVDHFERLEDEAEISDKYLSIFIDETEQSLNSLTETLLALEGEGGRQELEKLLVISHRIKGSAASIGLNRAAKLAHLMEDLLQNLLDTGSTLSTDMTDAMLKCTDALRKYTDDLRQGNSRSDHFGDVGHKLLGFQAAASGSVRASGEQPSASDAGENADLSREMPEASCDGPGEPQADMLRELRRNVANSVPEGLTAFVGEVRFQANLPLVGLKARLIYDKLARLGDICYLDPPLQSLEEIEELDRMYFGVTGETSQETINQHLRIGGVESVVVEPLEGKVSPGAEESRPKGGSAAGKAAGGNRGAAEGGIRPAETLRVDIERLDQLMNLSGQLVINKARFLQIGDSLKGLLGNKQSIQALSRVCQTLDKMAGGRAGPGKGKDLQAELEELQNQARRMQNDLEAVRRDVGAFAKVRTSVNDLFETIHQLNRVSDNIQQTVMDTRMLPIGPLFTRFKRVIRDITRANGKDVRLVINGEKTELDKRMIDELSDPLIHIVRNSADHGIELPEVRQAAGKPAQGTVTLEAFHRGNSIVIQVTDDGKGLDSDAIRSKAIDKGIITESDAEKMTRHQIYQLIWEPGLTTAQKVTEVSGRGMGMDIVKSKIEEINGVVDLDSEPGKGTVLTIKLPLTLAILPSLMIEIHGDVFAMPLESVIEIASVGKENLKTVYGQWTARVRGRVISVVRLSDVFTFSRRNAQSEQDDSDEATLVIVGEEGREIGLAVDQVLGEEDIVIKSMAENYRNVAGIAGASILGNGRVALILDVIALIDMSCHKSTTTQSVLENVS